MTLKVPPLQRNMEITRDDLPSDAYQIWWQSFIKALQDVISEQQQQITDIQSALDAAHIAQTTADGAVTSAVNAKKASARVNSYTVPTNVLSAVDGGTSASIVIAPHTRVYPPAPDLTIPSVSLTGTTLTGLAYSTAYYVYYDDATMASTTPAFQTTTSAATAQVGAGNARYFVGVVTTPASGGGGTTGGGGAPPGGGGGPIP